MAVKIFIKRQFKPGSLNAASRALNMARYGAMEQRGYISSETLSDLKDPNRVTVVSMWDDIADWEAWRSSKKRQDIEAEMADIVESPAEFEYFSLGMKRE